MSYNVAYVHMQWRLASKELQKAETPRSLPAAIFPLCCIQATSKQAHSNLQAAAVHQLRPPQNNSTYEQTVHRILTCLQCLPCLPP